MKITLVFLIIFFNSLFAKSYYSIKVETGKDIPVSNQYNISNQHNRTSDCDLLNDKILFDKNITYIGRFHQYKQAQSRLKKLKKSNTSLGKHIKIVKHTLRSKDNYLIFPPTYNNSNNKVLNLKKIYMKYSIKKIKNMFPKVFYGSSYILLNIPQITFIPIENLDRIYKLYKKNNIPTKILTIYDGVYSLEMLYQMIHNPKILEKVDSKTYELKYPLYISPTAKLIIKNSILRLESKPKPVFIIYSGSLFIQNSSILAWNDTLNKTDSLNNIDDKGLLSIGKERPRPYILGLNGSKTLFFNSSFSDLGYHDRIATFGISLLGYSKKSFLYNSYLTDFLGSASRPSGLYIGNNIYNNVMGFYTNRAQNVTLLGNYFYNNLIYNIDPHDYTANLTIARNITSKAKHAHGIIFSRQVNHSIIAQNFSFKNHSTGIMLDRLSNNNTIFDNLCMLNGYAGITSQESDNISILSNIVFLNYINGITIRNSLNNNLINNTIYKNGKNGIEVYVKDLQHDLSRNILADPYHKASSVLIKDNNISLNLNYNIMVKNSASITLQNNTTHDRYKNYGGDLEYFLQNIIKNNGYFKLYGRGFPYRRTSSDMIHLNHSSFETMVKIYKDLAKDNILAGDILSKVYYIFHKYNLSFKEQQREASNLVSRALANLGFFILKQEQHTGWKNHSQKVKGLSFIIKASIMGDMQATILIPYLKILSPITNLNIQEAYLTATTQMKNGNLFSQIDYSSPIICKSNKQVKNFIKSKLKIFKYKLHYFNVKTYTEFCQYSSDSQTIFTPQTLHRMQLDTKGTNDKKQHYQNYLTQTFQNANNILNCKRQLERKKYFSNESRKLLNEYKNRLITSFIPIIDRYIDMVNVFREKKIVTKHIISILKEDNETYTLKHFPNN